MERIFRPKSLSDMCAIADMLSAGRLPPPDESVAADLTWEQLSKGVPELEILYRMALYADDSSPRFCANAFWQRNLKPLVDQLVGWETPNNTPDYARTRKAYELAHDTIYGKLPPCKDCICM